jgi:hypothetical protein
MSRGLISAELPFMHKKALELLKADYPDRDGAQKQIVEGIENYYRTSFRDVYKGRRTLIDQAAETWPRFYLRNIFPDMKLCWGVHPNNLGHNDFPGCFRCHDGLHTSADGGTISNDCTT